MSSLLQHSFELDVSAAQKDIGGSVIQQDNGLKAIVAGSVSSAVVVGVFDGHGADRGQHFSKICKDQLNEIISDPTFKDQFDANPEEFGHEMFLKMHTACFEFNKNYLDEKGIGYKERDGLLHLENILQLRGGSTVTVIVACDDGKIHCFNVGDTDAWVIHNNKATQLHTDHSPDNLIEYSRIQSKWPNTKHAYDYNWKCGIAQRKDGNHIFPKRDEFTGYYRKNVSGQMATLVKVKNGEEYSHLAMTRSVADEPFRHGGIIWEPSYKCFQASQNCVVKVATDGYWDNIVDTSIVSNTQQEITKHNYNANALCQEWFTKTIKASKSNFGSSRDNMWGYIITLNK
jgi:serine/threonine protein phosphatase PrpC